MTTNKVSLLGFIIGLFYYSVTVASANDSLSLERGNAIHLASNYTEDFRWDDTTDDTDHFDSSKRNLAMQPPVRKAKPEFGTCVFTESQKQHCAEGVSQDWCNQQQNPQWSTNPKCP